MGKLKVSLPTLRGGQDAGWCIAPLFHVRGVPSCALEEEDVLEKRLELRRPLS